MALSGFWHTTTRRRLWGLLARLLNAGSKVRFGKGLACDDLPVIWRTAGGSLEIGRNVYLRSGVEIRVHQNARVVIGDNVRIDRGVRILASENAAVEVGPGCSIGLGTVLNAKDSITLGKDVLVSGYVYLQTSMHRMDGDGPIKEQGFDYAPVHVDDGAWLGAHAVVMPGVRVGKGAVLGANAVLTRDAEDGGVYAGVPAKKLSRRGEDPA